jgi:hypothetical protein
VRQDISAMFGGKKVELRETPRAVTPFGGMVVFLEFLRKVGYAEQVRGTMPFQLRSPNAIDPAETFSKLTGDPGCAQAAGFLRRNFSSQRFWVRLSWSWKASLRKRSLSWKRLNGFSGVWSRA